MIDVDYHRPRSLAEARRLKQMVPGARYVAGGTDLVVRMKDGRERPAALISLRRLPELTGLEQGDAGCRIGAGTTMAALAADPTIGSTYPVLAQAARRLGSPQIRSSATIGGNLCNGSPCADTATPLLVLDATVAIDGPRGSRTLPLSSWFTGPGRTVLDDDEILTTVLLPRPPAGARGHFSKQGRVYMDLALVNVAVQLVVTRGGRCDEARIAAGSVGPVPLLLERASRAVAEGPLSTRRIEQAAQIAAADVQPIDDVRATAAYRRQLVAVFVRRALTALASEEAR